jgi:hypothetical protein
MDDGATTPPQPQPSPADIRHYRVIQSRAIVLDSVDALYHLDIRVDSILGYLPYDTLLHGAPVDAVISQDLTAHAIQITYPLDVAANAGVVGYVQRSAVVLVAL